MFNRIIMNGYESSSSSSLWFDCPHCSQSEGAFFCKLWSHMPGPLASIASVGCLQSAIYIYIYYIYIIILYYIIVYIIYYSIKSLHIMYKKNVIYTHLWFTAPFFRTTWIVLAQRDRGTFFSLHDFAILRKGIEFLSADQPKSISSCD